MEATTGPIPTQIPSPPSSAFLAHAKGAHHWWLPSSGSMWPPSGAGLWLRVSTIGKVLTLVVEVPYGTFANIAPVLVTIRLCPELVTMMFVPVQPKHVMQCHILLTFHGFL